MATFLDSLTLQAQSHAAKVAAGEDVSEYEAFHNEFHALQSELHGMDCVELHAKVKELGVPASFAESKHELVDVIIDHVHAGITLSIIKPHHTHPPFVLSTGGNN